MAPPLSVASFPTRNDISLAAIREPFSSSPAGWRPFTYAKRRREIPGKLTLPGNSEKPAGARESYPDTMPFKFTRKRIFSLKTAASHDSSDIVASSSTTPSPATASLSSPYTPQSTTEDVVHIHDALSPDSTSSLGPSTYSGEDADWRFSLAKGRKPRQLPPLPDLDVPSRRNDKGRSLDLSPYADRTVQNIARASHSTESVMVFLHPTPSESLISLPSSKGPSLDDGTPPTAGPSTSTVPNRPDNAASRASGPQRRTRRREVATPYAFFITPLMFSSINPYMTTAQPDPAPSPLTDAKTQDKDKQHEAASPGPDGAQTDDGSAALSVPKVSFKRMTSRGKLFRRTTATTRDTSDTTSTTAADSPAAASLPQATTTPAVEHPRPPNADKEDDGGSVHSDPEPADPDHAATASDPRPEKDRRVEVAVTTVRMRKEVREESGVDQVLPRLRMLRAPGRTKP